MPLVRIDAPSATGETIRALSEAVQGSLVEAFAVPEDDWFHVLTSGSSMVVADSDYLGIHRDTGVVIVQVTMRSGRTDDQKRAFYAALAERVGELGLRPENLVVTLVENEAVDWSFGNGIAQYAS